MGFRTIQGLKWARLVERPSSIPKGRPKGAKALGVRYEKSLAKILGTRVLYGQWFEYEDRAGHGWGQSDFLIRAAPGEVSESIVVLESKYTWTPEGHEQIERLYTPLVEAIWQIPVRGVVVCKNLLDQKAMKGIVVCEKLCEAQALARNHSKVVWHWLGGYMSEPFEPGAWTGMI